MTRTPRMDFRSISARVPDRPGAGVVARAFWPLAILLLALASQALAEPPFTPKPRPDGGPWRIGYMQGGAYPQYASSLAGLVRGLAATGWIAPPGEDFPAASEDPAEIWTWMAAKAKSPTVSFVADAFWDAHWVQADRPATLARVITRLNGARDLDAVLAFGTWAGQDLGRAVHSTPVFVFQTSDPVAAGIVASPEHSGQDRLFAHTDPQRHKRQLRLFHDIVGFRRLGIAYMDNEVGRSYAAVADAEEVARERGFVLERCTPERSDRREDMVRRYLACHQDLAPRVDAMYLTHTWALTPENTEELIEPFLRLQVPTFAQGGDRFVRQGVLLGMAQSDFDALGLFFAQTLGRFMNGARPGDLNQVFEDVPHISLNIKTAKRIGFFPPMDLLSAVENIHDQDKP